MQLLAKRSPGTKVEIPMAPMIDIVFQLLIFFMLNLKIVAPEGDFNVNLPLGPGPGPAAVTSIPGGNRQVWPFVTVHGWFVLRV